MKLRLLTFMFAVVAVAIGSVYLGSATAQRKTPVETLREGKAVVERGKKVTTKGANPNIKSDKQDNDPNAAKVAASKGGTQTRGAGPYRCGVHVDNRTDLYIRIYVDGDYVGTVGRGGDLYPLTWNGPTTVYGIAYYSDGSPPDDWGPSVIPCHAGEWFTWKLTD